MLRLKTLFAVVAPFDDADHRGAIEGTDRRFLAVPLGQ